MNQDLQTQNSLNTAASYQDDFIEEKDTGPATRCVLFALEEETYGIQVKKIREVLRVGNIRKVPGAAYNVLGIINVRGVIVTIMDTRVMLNMPANKIDDHSRIIIIELEEEVMVGLLVDSVTEVKDIPEKDIEPLSSSKDNASRNIKGIAHFQGEVIILMDVDNIFTGLL